MDMTELEPVKSVDKATASMTRPRNADDKTVITRRAFATGAVAAVGALFLEPVAGERNLFWLPWAPEDAQADELNTVQVPADKILIAAKYFEKDSDGKVTSASGIGGVKVHVK